MKRIEAQAFALVTVLMVVLSLQSPVHAQSAAETLYKAKCAVCHGVDGSGSPMGKKMGAHDFTSVDVQRMSDAELADAVATGKNKMPKYGFLKPEDIKGLVAYIRTLKK